MKLATKRTLESTQGSIDTVSKHTCYYFEASSGQWYPRCHWVINSIYTDKAYQNSEVRRQAEVCFGNFWLVVPDKAHQNSKVQRQAGVYMGNLWLKLWVVPVTDLGFGGVPCAAII